jgi:hypothetical protein
MSSLVAYFQVLELHAAVDVLEMRTSAEDEFGPTFRSLHHIRFPHYAGSGPVGAGTAMVESL